MKSRLTLAGVCLLAAFGLAACGGGGGGGTTASTGGGAPPPTAEPPAATPLETAIELDGRLDDVDVDALQMSAIENAGKLTAESVKGDSAMAAANAQAILDADPAIRQAIVDADEVIEEANAAKEAAEAIEDAAEKAAVIRLLDDAIEEAEGIKTDAQAHIDEVHDPVTEEVDTLAEAVAEVTGADADNPNTPADAGEAVANTVATAIGAADPATNATAGDAPMGALRNDSADIGAMTWEQAVIARGGTVTDVRRFANNAISEVRAAPIGGFKVSDFLATNETAPTAGDQDDGTSFDSTRRGIEGTVFCGGTDCKVGDDGVMTGSWYFTPDSTTELFVANPAMAGSYMIATMYATYGYWLTYTDGDASGVSLHAATTGNTANLNLGVTTGSPELSATYTGSAVGISVHRDYDGNNTQTGIKSGEFTATVNLTARFGSAPMLGGTVSKFQGNAVDSRWSVTLMDTALGTGSFDNGVATGDAGETAGVWTTQGYGPAQTPGVGGGDPTNHRPTGFLGRFNANFSDGAAAGAYATRAD